MRGILRASVLTLSSLLLSAFMSGCDKADRTPAGKPSGVQPADAAADQHKHEHAAADIHTLAEGVAALQEHYQEIKAAFAEDDADKAHEPLHHVGDILEALPELGKTAGLSADDLTKLSQSVQTMFEAYGRIDDALHHNKPADYPAVAEQLDQSMTAINALAATPPPAGQ